MKTARLRITMKFISFDFVHHFKDSNVFLKSALLPSSGKGKHLIDIKNFSCNTKAGELSRYSDSLRDGPGIECRWGRDDPHLSRPVLGPTQPPIQWAPGLSRVEGGCCGVDHPRPSSAEIKDWVELYLYSSSVASWPVIGWTVTLLVLQHSHIYLSTEEPSQAVK